MSTTREEVMIMNNLEKMNLIYQKTKVEPGYIFEPPSSENGFMPMLRKMPGGVEFELEKNDQAYYNESQLWEMLPKRLDFNDGIQSSNL